MDLTHFDQDGNAWMVDVSDKDITTRTAVAEGFIAINDAIYERIEAGTIKRGCSQCGSISSYYGGETDE